MYKKEQKRQQWKHAPKKDNFDFFDCGSFKVYMHLGFGKVKCCINLFDAGGV